MFQRANSEEYLPVPDRVHGIRHRDLRQRREYCYVLPRPVIVMYWVLVSWLIRKSIKITFSFHFFLGNFFLTALINYRLINFSHSMLSLNFFFHWFVGCFNKLVSVLGSFWTTRQAECFVLFIIRNNSFRVWRIKNIKVPDPFVKSANPHSSIIKQTCA